MLRFSLRSWFVALVLGFVFCFAVRAERIEDLPKPENYVSDFAHVLSPQAQSQLNALCAQVDHQAKAQIAVVTIKTLDGDDIDDYTVRLEEKWKVGTKGTDRGIILLFAIQDRKRRIEVGYGLEGILPDGKVGDIGRNMVPYLRAGNYDQAISLGVTQIAQVIAADAGVTLDAPQARPVRRPQPQQLSFGALVFFFVAFLLILIFIGAVLSRVGGGGGGLLGFLLGMFLGSLNSGRRGGRGGDDWGGGGFGGGGGGGDSGFGGFDGGSSGGGGASGDW